MPRSFTTLATIGGDRLAAARSARPDARPLGARGGRLDLAGRRARAPGLLVRPRQPAAARTAPRRRPRCGDGFARARARRRVGELRRHGRGQRPLGHDPDCGRARGDADAPRHDRGRARRVGRRGRRRGDGGAERDAGGLGAVRPPRDPHGRRPAGVSRPARVPAGAHARGAGDRSDARGRAGARAGGRACAGVARGGAADRGRAAGRRSRRAGGRACACVACGGAAGRGRAAGRRSRRAGGAGSSGRPAGRDSGACPRAGSGRTRGRRCSGRGGTGARTGTGCTHRRDADDPPGTGSGPRPVRPGDRAHGGRAFGRRSADVRRTGVLLRSDRVDRTRRVRSDGSRAAGVRRADPPGDAGGSSGRRRRAARAAGARPRCTSRGPGGPAEHRHARRSSHAPGAGSDASAHGDATERVASVRAAVRPRGRSRARGRARGGSPLQAYSYDP